MICPKCEKGMIVGLAYTVREHPYRETSVLGHPEKYVHKVPCRQCNGSGILSYPGRQDGRQPVSIIGDTVGIEKIQPLTI